MVLSLDVSSLFTTVPVTETVDYICGFLVTNQIEVGSKELVLKCTLNVQFLFDNQLYKQIDNVAIGSRLGPLLANIFMGELDKFQLTEQIHELKHYDRYVHDVFAIAPTETDLNALLNTVVTGYKAHLGPRPNWA
ncbi:unnamed protein product [Dibothriocephalus latus]|uniref:Reverse transcriptase domain-containing protein n=1 Tax=Dibothriocephalus latus TaxID=60516 RepID=A0A3P6QKD1_DIBLA|nr:unnamed protein product [Dibothriocephalus latus]